MDQAFETAAAVTKIVAAARQANKAIAETNSFELLSVLSLEKAHIAELLQPLFVSRTGIDRLPRLTFYLQAIKQRVEKMNDNPMRDRVAMKELDEALEIYSRAGGQIPLAQDSPEKIVTARWLLEELRISLFAQNLGTSETVSVTRIKKALS